MIPHQASVLSCRLGFKHMFLARVQRSRRLWKFNIDSHGNSERCIPAIIIETNTVDEIKMALTPSVQNKEGRKVKKND